MAIFRQYLIYTILLFCFLPAIHTPEEVYVIPDNIVRSHHQIVFLHQFTQPTDKDQSHYTDHSLQHKHTHVYVHKSGNIKRTILILFKQNLQLYINFSLPLNTCNWAVSLIDHTYTYAMTF